MQSVEPRIDVVTLAVADLERALAFYRDGLGFSTSGITGTQYPGDDETPAGDVVMCRLQGGLTFALYPRSELAKDAEIPAGPAQSGEFSLGWLVESRAEVDELLARAEAAGATVMAVADRPWGIYSGYFRDPDGHLWEVIHNQR
jgi:catechol 2,3-dioxygenase-like lactoylglutathione lyase family enzyme